MGADPAPFYLPLQVKEPLLIATMDAAALRLYADCSFPLHDAEKLLDTIDGVMLMGTQKPRPTQLLLTTFRLIFLDSPPFTNSQPWALLIEVPFGVVYKTEETAEKESGRVHMKLYCRDFRTVSFTLPRKHQKLSKVVSNYNMDGVGSVIASQHDRELEDAYSYMASGWGLHLHGFDFERMGISASWVELVQKDYDICVNYPETILLPKGLNSADLTALRKNRSFGAVPVLSYYRSANGAALLRAASEGSDITDLRGDGGGALEKFLSCVGTRCIHIVDVGGGRGSAGSRAALGWSADVSRQYIELGSVQDITNVMRKLLLLRKGILSHDWVETLAQVGFLDLVQRTITAAQSIAALIEVWLSLLFIMSFVYSIYVH